MPDTPNSQANRISGNVSPPSQGLSFSLEFRALLREEPLAFIEVENGNLLGADDAAMSLAKLIDVSPGGSLIGLWGNWGVGKTRVLELLKARLSDGAVNGFELPDRGLTITPVLATVFNPWKVRASEMTWVEALTGAIVQAVKNGAKVSVDDAELKTRIGAATSSFEKAKLWNNVKAVTSFLAEMAGRGTSALEQTEIDYAARDRLSWKTTVEYLQSLLDEEGKCRLLVIVDDLDRCEADMIRVILDTCSNCLIDSDVTFLFATDRQSVVSSLTHLLPERSRQAANKYLEKLVPIDFAMPKPTNSQIKKYVDCLIGRARAAEKQLPYVAILAEVLEPIDEHEIKMFRIGIGVSESNLGPEVKSEFNFGPEVKAAYLFDARLLPISRGSTNPRRIKRMLTRYLRIIERWADIALSAHQGLGQKPGAATVREESRINIINRSHLMMVELLCAATNIAFIKESHPEFFKDILDDKLRGKIAIDLYRMSRGNRLSVFGFNQESGQHVPEENSIQYRRMNELGLNSDNELLTFFDALARCNVPYEEALHLARFG